MRRCIPAGSAYYFRILDGNGMEIIKAFDQRNISDELAEEGFGFCLVGVIGGFS